MAKPDAVVGIIVISTVITAVVELMLSIVGVVCRDSSGFDRRLQTGENHQPHH